MCPIKPSFMADPVPDAKANCLAVHAARWTQGRQGTSYEAGRRLEETWERQTPLLSPGPADWADPALTQRSAAAFQAVRLQADGTKRYKRPWPSASLATRVRSATSELSCSTVIINKTWARVPGHTTLANFSILTKAKTQHLSYNLWNTLTQHCLTHS